MKKPPFIVSQDKVHDFNLQATNRERLNMQLKKRHEAHMHISGSASEQVSIRPDIDARKDVCSELIDHFTRIRESNSDVGEYNTGFNDALEFVIRHIIFAYNCEPNTLAE